MQTKKILSVKPLGKRKTLDFEVDNKDHNFYAEGLVSSNSHAVAYGMLTAWTTYLKFKYPKEFFCSLLRMSNNEPDPREEISKISKELVHFNIKLLPPDLAKSEMDFCIEGDNIRFGLNAIKGVSKKSLQNVLDFRDEKRSTKYDIFLTAKQSGINIGILSALIQAGALDSGEYSRSRLVLEAQTFNKLTDTEKRNFVALGEEHDYDILNSIKTVVKEKTRGDTGRLIVSDKRFETIKRDYAAYKAIYDQNKKQETFANWYFENKLLGYSYSCSLAEAFKDEAGTRFNNSIYYNSLDKNNKAKFIGQVEDCNVAKSKNGNKYLKFTVGDDYGFITGLMVDNKRFSACSDYIDSGKPVPEKGNIITFCGSKGDDIVFVQNLQILDDKIYMKLSDVK